jgi:phage tail-like protein
LAHKYSTDYSGELGEDVAIDPKNPDSRPGQVSRLLGYLPAIFQELPGDSTDHPLPVGRFLMAFESILLGLPKSRGRGAEWPDLLYQPGFEEILGGAEVQGSPPETLLEGIDRYFDPGPDYPTDKSGLKIENYNRAPPEFLSWLAGWVALTLRDDWTDDHKRMFIARAAQLYRLRGTKAGVAQFVQTYMGGPQPEIIEEIAEFQVGVHSQIGVDTFLDGGTPFFFKVKPKISDPLVFQKQVNIVTALIELQKPAHTSFTLEPETVQFQIGDHSQIGVDTLLGTR